jgi:CheY-like chemotaxis protein
MAAKHVPVVDDYVSMRDMIAGYLEGRGFRVTTLADGTQWRASSTESRSI